MNIFIENLSNILKIYNSERRELEIKHLGSRIAKDSRVPTTEVFNKALNTVKQKCFHSIYYLYHNNYGKINFSKPIQLTYEYNDITFDYVEEYNTLLVEAIKNCIIDIYKIIYEFRGFTKLQLFSKIVKRYNLYIADRNKINDDNISKNAKKQYIYYIEINKYTKKQIPIKQTILKQIIDIKKNPDNFIRENYSAKEYLKLFESFFEREYSHKGVFSGITYINFSDIISSETDIEIQNYYNNDILECYLYIYINIFKFDFDDDNVYVKFYDNINEKIENHYYYNTNIIELSNNIKKNTRSLSLLFKQLINSNTITLNDKRMFNDPYLKVLDDINSNLLYTRSLDSYNKSIIEKLFTKLDYIYNFLLSEEYINIPDKSKIDDNFTEDRIQEYLYNGLYFFQIRMYLFDIYKSAPDTISEQICITLERFYYLLYLENLKNFDSYIQTAEKSITQKVNISSVYNRGKPEKPKEPKETPYVRQAATSEVKPEEKPYERQAATSEVKPEEKPKETRRPTLVKLAPIAPIKKIKLQFYLFQLACNKKQILNKNSLVDFFYKAPDSLNLAPLTDDRTVLYIKAHILFKIQHKYNINSFNTSSLIKDKNIIYYLDLNNNRKKELYKFANFIIISVKKTDNNQKLIDNILKYIYMTFDDESSVSSKLNTIFGVDNFSKMIDIINNPDSNLTEINNKIKDLLYEINAINDRNIQSNSFLINKIYTKNISNNQEIISLLFEIFRDNPNKYEDILNELFRIFKIDFSDNIDRKIDELNNKLQTPITENKDEIISDLKKMIPKNYILFSYEDYSTTSKFYYDKLNKELLIILLKKIKEIDVNNIFKSIYDSYNRIYLYISYKNNNDTEWSYKKYYELTITPFKFSDYYKSDSKTPIIIKEQKLNTDIIRIDELIKLSKNETYDMNILNECKIMFLNLVLFYNLLVFLGKTYGFYNSSITFNNLLYDRNKGTLLFFTLDSIRFTKKDNLNQTLSNIDNIIKENSFSIHDKQDLSDITYDKVFSDIIKTVNKDYYFIFDLINLASLFKIPFLVHLLLSFKYSVMMDSNYKTNLIFFINKFNQIFKLFNFDVPHISIQSEDIDIDINIDIDKLLTNINTYIFTNIGSIRSNLDNNLIRYNDIYDEIISHSSNDYMKTTLITLLEGLLLEYLFNIFKGNDNDKEDFINFLKSDVIAKIRNGNHSILCIFRDSNCINLTTRGGSKKKKRGGTLIPINGISGIIDKYLNEIKKEYLESKYITAKTKQDTNKLIEIYKRIIE